MSISSAIKYLKFLQQSTNAHGLHSPFAIDLYNHVIKDDRQFYAFKEIEGIRASLKKNENTIEYEDHGSGSNSGKRSIASIANNALSFPYQCRIMFRLIDFLDCKEILELGTSLGISTLYLAMANSGARVTTLEGDTGSYSMATHIFHEMKQHNIKCKLGLFNETLGPALRRMKSVDFVFIDGHHDEKATLQYFDNICNYTHKDSVIVVDDIYWSKGMEKAWESIKSNKNVRLTFDLFFCGIVFFRNENKEEEHFKIRPDKLLFHR